MRLRASLGLCCLLLGACQAGPAGSSAALTDALAGATPGSVVEVAAVRLSGSFVVPPGVTLRGAGAGATTLVGSGGQALSVRTAPGSDTVVTGLAVESDGPAAIAVGGSGSARLEDVDVRLTRGVGIGAEGLAALDLTRVTVSGPVTQDNATMQPVEPSPDNSASHGIVIVGVSAATLNDVEVSGIAMVGALFVDSGTTWTGGGASGNLGTGLMAAGGSITLDGLEVCRTLQGFRLPPVFGGVFTGGAAVETRGLTVCQSDGYGLVHANASGHHENLVGAENANAALWIQQSSGVSVDGATTVFSDNQFAGIVVIDSDDITVADASVERTQTAIRTVGLTGRVEVGDGVQLVRSVTAISMSNLTLADNERAGMLLDLGTASTDDIALTAVSATGMGTELGVVAQSGTIGPGWDADVMRSAALLSNDTAFFAAGVPLEVVEVVTPTDIPATAALSSGGLSVVGVVTPTD